MNQRVGSAFNELDGKKRDYILRMRQSFIEVNKNIYFEDGSLNFKYFNVKKGHYWSHEINDQLIKVSICASYFQHYTYIIEGI